MEPSPAARRIVRFGIFEVDLKAGELRKRGRKVKLQDQPFQVLALLLLRRGELVTREELRNALWPADTFVEFDHGLNTAIKKIRQALGDSPHNPRFIETLPRHGYRFIAAVDEGPQPPPVRRRHSVWLVALVAIAGIAGLLAWWLSRSRHSAPQPKLIQLTKDAGLTCQPALSPDGKLVAYASDRSGEGNLDIWVQQVEAGGPLRLTRHKADDHSPTFSPDGTRIAFRSERYGGGVYLVPTLGGEERLIVPEGQDPQFSPDGDWIAYWVGAKHLRVGEVYVVPSAGGEPRELQEGHYPVWLDGEHLLYAGPARGQEGDDWRVTRRGGGETVRTGAYEVFRRHNLSPARWSDFVPDAWSIEGGCVIFSAKQGDSVNLWKAPISPGNWRITELPQRLTVGTGMERQVSIAASGRLVFSSLSEDYEVWSLPIDANRGKVTGQEKRLTASTAADVMPSVSADGTQLVFISDRLGTRDVWAKNLESGKEIALAATSSRETGPTINAGGTWVAYKVGREGGPFSIYVVPISGGIARKVCNECGLVSDWSRDGNQLLIFTFKRSPSDAGMARISMLDVNTGRQTELLQHPEDWPVWPRFSPDNRWIAFHLYRSDHRRQIFIAPVRADSVADLEKWIMITDSPGSDACPAWSPDGNLLYFLSDRDGFQCIWAQRLNPVAKRPFGSPMEVCHFHDSRRSLINVSDPGAVGMAVARDKIVFAMPEITGNIWLMEPQGSDTPSHE